MRRSLALAGLVLLLAVAGVALALSTAARAQREPVRATLSTSALLGAGDTTGFERALAPRAFNFHGERGGARRPALRLRADLLPERADRGAGGRESGRAGDSGLPRTHFRVACP